MSIELNRATFRRLVQLYLLLLVISVAAVTYENIVWWGFAEEFDRLASEHFGTPSDLQLFSLGGIGLAGFIAHLVAAVGLLRFKRWGRSLLCLSLIPLLALGFIPGFQVIWMGVLSTWVELIGLGLLGAIVLLAYARGYGGDWFQKRLKEHS